MKENAPIYIKFKTKMLPKNDKDTLSGQQKKRSCAKLTKIFISHSSHLIK